MLLSDIGNVIIKQKANRCLKGGQIKNTLKAALAADNVSFGYAKSKS